MTYLLDTNICIYLIKKHPVSVIQKIKKLKPSQIKISSISFAELQYGIAKSKPEYQQKNKDALLDFVSAFDIIPFDDSDAEIFGFIRAALEKRGEPIGAYDLQIAAQAIAKKLILVTNNVKEFSKVPGIKIENWV